MYDRRLEYAFFSTSTNVLEVLNIVSVELFDIFNCEGVNLGPLIVWIKGFGEKGR